MCIQVCEERWDFLKYKKYIRAYFFILAVIVRIFLKRFYTIWRDVCLTKALGKKSADSNNLFISGAILFILIVKYFNVFESKVCTDYYYEFRWGDYNETRCHEQYECILDFQNQTTSTSEKQSTAEIFQEMFRIMNCNLIN